MKIIIAALLSVLLVSCCNNNPVEPGSNNLKLLWKIYSDGIPLANEIIQPNQGSFGSDGEYFYYHNSLSDNNSRVYKISFEGKIVKVSEPIGRHTRASKIIIADNKLYTSSPRKGVFCLDKNTLQVIWHVPVNAIVGSILVSDSAMLYVATELQYIKTRELETGAEIWKTEIYGTVAGPCAVDDSQLYVSTLTVREDGFLYYINKKTGEIEKKIVLPFIEENNTQFGGAYTSGVTVYKDRVFVGCNNRYVYCFDKGTGEKLWEFLTDSPVSAPLTVTDDILFTGTLNSSVYALDINNGSLKWKYFAGGSIIWFPHVYRNYLIQTDADLVVFDKYNGNIVSQVGPTDTSPFYYHALEINKTGQMIVAAVEEGDTPKYLFMSFQLN